MAMFRMFFSRTVMGRFGRDPSFFRYVEGDVAAAQLLVHKGGQCYGTVKTDTAEVEGTLQGDVVVKNLISIKSSGSVSGNMAKLPNRPGWSAISLAAYSLHSRANLRAASPEV